MVILIAQKLRDLETNGSRTSTVEEQLRRLVHLGHHLLGVHEHTSVIYQVELLLKQVGVRHDALQVVHVEQGRTEDVVQGK